MAKERYEKVWVAAVAHMSLFKISPTSDDDSDTFNLCKTTLSLISHQSHVAVFDERKSLCYCVPVEDGPATSGLPRVSKHNLGLESLKS